MQEDLEQWITNSIEKHSAGSQSQVLAKQDLIASQILPGVIDSVIHPVSGIPSTCTIRDSSFRIYTPTKQNVPSLAKAIRLIDSGLGDLYLKVNGVHWLEDKAEEATEPGLIYLAVEDEGELMGFISFMHDLDNGIPVLFLYEIHVAEPFRDRKLGSELLAIYHALGEKIVRDWRGSIPLVATSLTVFTANTRALSWYEKQGYEIADHSPKERRLRNATRKPEYYILIRWLARDQ